MKQGSRYLYSLASALLVTVLIGLGLLQRMDRWMQDGLFQHPGVTSADIVIIGIDEQAFDLLGPYNTWDRNIIASALETLGKDSDKRPAVTAVDILYAGNSSEQADQRLAEAAGRLGNVITASMAEFGEEITWENGRAAEVNTSAVIGYEEPYEALRDCTKQGHINAMVDVDGVLRHGLLYVDPDGEKDNRVYSLAYETVRTYLEQKGLKPLLPKTGAGGHLLRVHRGYVFNRRQRFHAPASHQR